jgi:hypothetical protein
MQLLAESLRIGPMPTTSRRFARRERKPWRLFFLQETLLRREHESVEH